MLRLLISRGIVSIPSLFLRNPWQAVLVQWFPQIRSSGLTHTLAPL